MDTTQPHLPHAPEPQEDAFDHWRHALRSPLNALLVATAVLEAAPPGSQVASQALRIIARQARHLAWLITDTPAKDAAGP